MGKTRTLELTQAGGPARVIQLTFEDDEWDNLRAASQEVLRLDLDGLVASGRWRAEVTLKWEEGVGFTGSRSGPSDDDIAIALHRLRPFLLNDEQTHFYRVVKILSRRGSDDAFRASLDGLRDLYSGAETGRRWRIDVDGTPLNSEAWFKTYLNAVEYHRDADKGAQLDALRQIVPDETIRGVFVSLLIDILCAVGALGQLLDVVFGDLEFVVERNTGLRIARQPS